MRPNHAAWLFVAGIGWLVFKAIFTRVFEGATTGDGAEFSGLSMLLSLISVLASATAPLFFFSLLRHRADGGRPRLRLATVTALVASTFSLLLVVTSFAAAVAGRNPTGAVLVAQHSLVVTIVPMFFVASLFLFLLAFSREEGENETIRRAAVVAAIGTLFPLLSMVGWILYTQGVGITGWIPDFSRSLVAKAMGLAAAASLVWFLETFAVNCEQ